MGKNWRDMTIAEGLKYPGFFLYLVIEFVLLLCAIGFVFMEHFVEAILIFILIEVREIRSRMKYT